MAGGIRSVDATFEVESCSRIFTKSPFPLPFALGARGGPVRRTDVVTLASGAESRNARWARSRRRYDAGLAVRNLDALHEVIDFFEEATGAVDRLSSA